MRHYILLNYGGTLTLNVDALPSAATVSITHGNTTYVDAASITDLGSSTTSTALAGVSQDDPRVMFADTSGFSVGDSVVVADEYGQEESNVILGLDADQFIFAKALSRDYAIGSTVSTRSISYTVADDVFSDVKTNVLARFILDGSVVRDLVFDVVKSPIQQPLSPSTLMDMSRETYEQCRDDEDASAKLERSWDLCLEQLASAGLYPRYIVADTQLKELHLIATKLIMAEDGIEPATEVGYFPGGVAGYFAQRMNAIVENLKIKWLDTDSDLVSDDGESNIRRQIRIKY